MVYPSDAWRKPPEAILALLTRAYFAYLPETARMGAPGFAWPSLTRPFEAPCASVLEALGRRQTRCEREGVLTTSCTHPLCNRSATSMG
jgi:hypothetical protein